MHTQRPHYHHGHLAESLLDAVDELATQFGLEAVTLRACAKRVGVAPSSAFRHYEDKRALLTAFATRALNQLVAALEDAEQQARLCGGNALHAVGLAYVGFALDKPAFFRAMWREETIYAQDAAYVTATRRLAQCIQGGFARTLTDADPDAFSPQELLAWSSVHGLASLLIDGPLAKGKSRDALMAEAGRMIGALDPALDRPR
ncbi:MAG: TetR/AcrR family transcriptional regulator [Rhodocyclaceae bacterium]|nr:TetR/AcrR family transcriptional regulator [Rhodocyclaceae bacterium]